MDVGGEGRALCAYGCGWRGEGFVDETEAKLLLDE